MTTQRNILTLRQLTAAPVFLLISQFALADDSQVMPVDPQSMDMSVIAPDNANASDNLATDWLSLESDPETDRRFAESVKRWEPNKHILLRAGAQLWVEEECDSLESIECDNRAHGSSYQVGASWQPKEQISVNLDYSTSRLQLVNGLFNTGNNHLFDASLSEDLSLSCDINAGEFGELALGVQWSRLEPGVAAPQAQLGEFYQQAVFDVGWTKGAFSGGVTSRLLDPASEGSQSSPWTTFDINFDWRMPWNAKLSVGAKNLLDQPPPEQNQLDSFDIESRFGRIPYVRYQQDL